MDNAQFFFAIQLKDIVNTVILIVTGIAVWLGPIKAVEVGQKREAARERTRRQHEIFSSLMKTRRIVLHVDKISALNTIQVEFFDNSDVMSAFKTYITHLYRPIPSEQNGFAHHRETDDYFYELLSRISKCLGYNFDKRDLERDSYLPNGMIDEETQQRAFRTMALELLNGARSLSVVMRSSTPLDAQLEKFPPPPP